jgi:hypothetical protein
VKIPSQGSKTITDKTEQAQSLSAGSLIRDFSELPELSLAGKKKFVKNILLIFYGKLKRVKMRTTRGEEIDAERGGYQNSWTRGWG